MLKGFKKWEIGMIIFVIGLVLVTFCFVFSGWAKSGGVDFDIKAENYEDCIDEVYSSYGSMNYALTQCELHITHLEKNKEDD